MMSKDLFDQKEKAVAEKEKSAAQLREEIRKQAAEEVKAELLAQNKKEILAAEKQKIMAEERKKLQGSVKIFVDREIRINSMKYVGNCEVTPEIAEMLSEIMSKARKEERHVFEQNTKSALVNMSSNGQVAGKAVVR